MVTQEQIDKAVEILVREARPEKIILFGSYARGDAHADSDVDFLVIEHRVDDQRLEMVRLRKALSPLRIPVDVAVASLERVNSNWADFPGSYLYHALREGKVVYENMGSRATVAS